MAGVAYKPIVDENGNPIGPSAGSVLADPGPQPTLREFLALGAGKAHRSIVYSHYDHRNFKKDHLGDTGKIK